MFHPMQAVCNGEHDGREYGKMHTALFGNAPVIQFPNDGCYRKAGAEHTAQKALYNNGIQLTSKLLY